MARSRGCPDPARAVTPSISKLVSTSGAVKRASCRAVGTNATAPAKPAKNSSPRRLFEQVAHPVRSLPLQALQQRVVGESSGGRGQLRESLGRAEPDVALLVFEQARDRIGRHAVARVIGTHLGRFSDRDCSSRFVCRSRACPARLRYTVGHRVVPEAVRGRRAWTDRP